MNAMTPIKSLLLVSFAGIAAAAEPQHLNFLSCPIVRDTSTVPCWLTRYEGELYYLGIQTDVSAAFRPPWLGHRVLVEGVVSGEARICGGVVLTDLRISVMPELDPSCDEQLPAEARYTIDFNPRPPGPSGGRLAFEGADPNRYPSASDLEGPEFLLTFDVDRSIEFRHPLELMRIIDYAKTVSATAIRVHGSRGSTLLTDGSTIVESDGVSKRRAEDVARMLRSVDLDADISATWSDEPSPADGVDDWKSRSVTVVVDGN